MTATINEPINLLNNARTALESERDASGMEIDALTEFRTRVTEIVSDRTPIVSRPTHATEKPGSIPTVASTFSETLRSRLRTAYCETVMTVPTVDELEGNVRDHMAAELSPDAANAVFAQAGPPPDAAPVLQGQIESAIESRRQVLRQCQAEMEALDVFAGPLEEIRMECRTYQSDPRSHSFEDLVAHHDRATTLVAMCDRVARRRQEYLQRELVPGYRLYEFTGYVYRDCRSQFPVLSATAEIASDVRNLRRGIVREIVRY